MEETYVVGGFCQSQSRGICTRWRANWIRLAITAYYSITCSFLECGLQVKDLYSCKIMTQSLLVNSARGTLKAKNCCTSFHWCLDWYNQWTWIPLNWCGMILTEKSELNNPQVRFTSENSCRKAGKNYLQSLEKRMQRIFEAVIVAKEDHLMNHKFNFFLVWFVFIGSGWHI